MTHIEFIEDNFFQLWCFSSRKKIEKIELLNNHKKFNQDINYMYEIDKYKIGYCKCLSNDFFALILIRLISKIYFVL